MPGVSLVLAVGFQCRVRQGSTKGPDLRAAGAPGG